MRFSKSSSSIIVAVVILLVLASVAFITPLSAGAGNASSAAVTTHTARVGNAPTAAVKTPHIVGAGTWNIQTADSVGGSDTSLQLTPTGWPAISYRDNTNTDLKYTYKSAS